jgi:hypothetical protein
VNSEKQKYGWLHPNQANLRRKAVVVAEVQR